ncbi:unnamed protein product [Caretta caretta]
MPTYPHREMISLAHNQGHFCVAKTVGRITSVAWWPDIIKDVTKYIQNCLACAKNNSNRKVIKGPMLHQGIGGPWSCLQIDDTGSLPCTGCGHKYCLVVMDSFMKWVEAYPTRDSTAITMAKVLMEQTFTRFGLPEIIDYDQRPHFMGKVMKTMCQPLGICQKLHIAGHPQSYGLVEQINRTIKAVLRKIISGQGKNWDQKLPLVLMAMRLIVSSHGFTPHEVLMERLIRTPEHWWLGGSPLR